MKSGMRKFMPIGMWPFSLVVVRMADKAANQRLSKVLLDQAAGSANLVAYLSGKAVEAEGDLRRAEAIRQLVYHHQVRTM